MICDYCHFEIPALKVGKWIIKNPEYPQRNFCTKSHLEEWTYRSQKNKSGVLISWKVGVYYDRCYFIKTIREVKGSFITDSRFSEYIDHLEPLEVIESGGVKTLRVAKT